MRIAAFIGAGCRSDRSNRILMVSKMVCSFILGHVGIELHVFVSSCVVNATILAYAITCFVPLSLLEDCYFYRSWLSK